MQIEGIGEKKAKALLKHFKTISAIKEQTPEKLAECPSVSRKDAGKIYEFYHKM